MIFGPAITEHHRVAATAEADVKRPRAGDVADARGDARLGEIAILRSIVCVAGRFHDIERAQAVAPAGAGLDAYVGSAGARLACRGGEVADLGLERPLRLGLGRAATVQAGADSGRGGGGPNDRETVGFQQHLPRGELGQGDRAGSLRGGGKRGQGDRCDQEAHLHSLPLSAARARNRRRRRHKWEPGRRDCRDRRPPDRAPRSSQ